MEKYLDITNKLIRSLENSSLEFIEFKLDNFSLTLEKNSLLQDFNEEKVLKENINKTYPNEIIDENYKKEKNSDKYNNIETLKAPILGVFYSSQDPESAPFVKVGDEVKEGEILCIIEAMKMMNEIKAPYDCKIIECLVSNEEFLEYGKEIFKLEKL